MNILSNALQAIEGPGNIWISTITTKDPKTKTSCIEVSIQDSGKGIPPEIVDKVFDPFFLRRALGKVLVLV